VCGVEECMAGLQRTKLSKLFELMLVRGKAKGDQPRARSRGIIAHVCAIAPVGTTRVLVGYIFVKMEGSVFVFVRGADSRPLTFQGMKA